MSRFPQRLKLLREEKQLYQKDLAKALDLSRSTITAYESGKREPDQNTLNRIANLFDVSVDYLMGRTEFRKFPSHEEDSIDLSYIPPRDLDTVLRETNVTFNGTPLTEEDKEDLIELIKVALKTIKKRK